MKTMFKALALAMVSVAGTASFAPVAQAQAVPGIAVADIEEAVAKSNAAVVAANQIQLTYKAQIDAANARATALNGELQGLMGAFQTAQKAPNPNQQVLQQQYAAIQKKQQDGQREVQTMSEPFNKANAYAVSQIRAKLEQAVRNAMTKKRVSILLQPEALLVPSPTSDITNDVIAELNVLVPSVSISPPAGWPNQQGGAPAPAAAPAAPAKPQPQGR